MIESMSAGRSGSSIGWVVTQMWSRMYSDGARFSAGTSARSRFQCLSSRQASAGSQAKPPSTSTTLRSGISSKTPSQTRLVTRVCMDWT